MSLAPHEFLEIVRGDAPLVVSLPHTGTTIPAEIEARLVSPWLARKDTDWWIERLYDFAGELGATIVRTDLSRTVIDVNRDPSGASLYPGRATTELCPTTTFDGEPLYRPGEEPDAAEIAARRASYFDWYHRTLAGEIGRLRTAYEHLVLYDCHSIRSRIPRLFDGELPHFNIGTNGGSSCDPALAADDRGPLRRKRLQPCRERPLQGRLHHPPLRRSGERRPRGPDGARLPRLHARTARPSRRGWPTPYDEARAAPMRAALTRILKRCLRLRRTTAGREEP